MHTLGKLLIFVLAMMVWGSFDFILERHRIAAMVWKLIRILLMAAVLVSEFALLAIGAEKASIGVALIVFGLSTNFAALTFNGWKMPCYSKGDIMHKPIDEYTRLLPFCDVIGPFSIGDLCLCAGFLLLR